MMKKFKLIIAYSITSILVSCVASPGTPGGKLGTKNYLGNYTLGAGSGPATTYLEATGDTTIEVHYSLNSGPNITLTNVGFTEVSGGYQLYKTDIVGTLTGNTTTDFESLTWQYVSGANTTTFTGNKID